MHLIKHYEARSARNRTYAIRIFESDDCAHLFADYGSKDGDQMQRLKDWPRHDDSEASSDITVLRLINDCIDAIGQEDSPVFSLLPVLKENAKSANK